MGKGSKRRPAAVPDEVVEENWNMIFEDKDEDSMRRAAAAALLVAIIVIVGAVAFCAGLMLAK